MLKTNHLDMQQGSELLPSNQQINAGDIFLLSVLRWADLTAGLAE